MDESLLDDHDAVVAADRSQLLRAVATSGAQIRAALSRCEDAGVRRVADDGRPRSLVVLAAGASSHAGAVLQAVAGPTCPVPIACPQGFTLPGWVGPLDLVMVVGGATPPEETSRLAEEAVRRGTRLLVVSPPGGALAELARQARGLHVPLVKEGRPSRADLWSRTVPLLVAADALRLLDAPHDALARAADRADRTAERCGPAVEPVHNPAKTLALQLVGALPLLWASGDVAGAVAHRLADRIAVDAGVPAVADTLPAAGHAAAALLDGSLKPDDHDLDDFFRDRVDDDARAPRPRVLLVRDAVEHPRVQARREALVTIAESRGVAWNEIVADAGLAVERLAQLLTLCDMASVYLALVTGTDPDRRSSVTELSERMRR